MVYAHSCCKTFRPACIKRSCNDFSSCGIVKSLMQISCLFQALDISNCSQWPIELWYTVQGSIDTCMYFVAEGPLPRLSNSSILYIWTPRTAKSLTVLTAQFSWSNAITTDMFLTSQVTNHPCFWYKLMSPSIFVWILLRRHPENS